MFTVATYFNNFDLNTLPGVKITSYDVNNLPSRNLTANKLARANRSLLTSAEYSEKTIYVYGFVGGANLETLQENFDRLKGQVQDVEGLIRVPQGNTEVEYIGTLNGISKSYIGLNINFTLEFKCSNPIGRDSIGSELFTPVTITTATISQSFTVEGSFIATPRFRLVLTNITDGTAKSVSLLNSVTGKGIKITRNWADGEILSVNSDTFEVVVDGGPVDFNGQFPTFFPGVRTLQYIDDFTARNITLSAIYTKQYS